MHRLHSLPIVLLSASSLAAAPPVPADRPAASATPRLAAAAPAAAPPVPADRPPANATPRLAAALPERAASPAAASPVPADRPPAGAAPRIAVVAPELRGFRHPTLAGQIAEQLRRGSERGPVVVLPAADVDAAARVPCDDTCLGDLRTALAADYVLRSSVTQIDRDLALRLELVDASSRAAVAVAEATCELCGQEELRAFAADQATRLLGPLAGAALAAPRLQLDSFPAGATAAIDGRPVGVTPLVVEVPAGDRVVTLAYAGHVTQERSVVAPPGVEVRVHMNLRRTPVTTYSRRPGYALLFTGLAPTLAGVGLLAVDDRAAPRHCQDAPVDAAGRCVHRLSTAWAGASLLTAGALLITAGALLLARPIERKQRRVQAGVGAGLEIRGSF